MGIDHDVFLRCFPGYNSDRLRGLRYFAITFYSLTAANGDRNDHTGTRHKDEYLGMRITHRSIVIAGIYF